MYSYFKTECREEFKKITTAADFRQRIGATHVREVEPLPTIRLKFRGDASLWTTFLEVRYFHECGSAYKYRYFGLQATQLNV